MFVGSSGFQILKLKNVRLLSRCLLFSGILVILMLFVALPTTPVNTYLSSSNCVWHISKASRASEVGIEGAGVIPTADQRFQLQEPNLEGAALFSPVMPFPTLPRLLRVYHFRPPPLS